MPRGHGANAPHTLVDGMPLIRHHLDDHDPARATLEQMLGEQDAAPSVVLVDTAKVVGTAVDPLIENDER